MADAEYKCSIPEMAGGWGSALMQKENEFLLLDGM